MARRSDTLEQALARLFTGSRRRGAELLSVAGGQTLITAGQPSSRVYLLKSGRLGVFRPEPDGRPRFIGLIRPGEPAGEISLLAGTAHASTVVALRDSEVLALSRDTFVSALRDRPEIAVELARLMIARLRALPQASSRPTVFGFVGASGPPLRPFVEHVAQEARRLGFPAAVVAEPVTTEALDTIEAAHDVVLCLAESDDPAWAGAVARQSDRLFLCGETSDPPPIHPIARPRSDEARRLTDLILFRDADTIAAEGARRWIDALDPARWFHVRRGSPDDTARLARVVTGTSIGLVLSGGGARAYAHVGALRVFREAGARFDFLGGASMGAVIAAEVAAGHDQQTMEARLRHAFVRRSPLSDVAVPILAMTRGRRVDRLLEEAYGDARIADLPLPFFAVSSNLTSGAPRVHDRGWLGRALRASIALPGVLPPVIEAGQVLVDGAVMKNFPAETMREINDGPVVGVDVSRARGVDAAVIEQATDWRGWVRSGGWRNGPPIVSILMRSATVTTAADLEASRAATDLLVLPEPDRVEIRDWKAWEPAVAAGATAATAALDTLWGPLTHLRRRRIAAVPDLEPSDAKVDEPSGASRKSD